MESLAGLHEGVERMRRFMLAGVTESLASTNCVDRVAARYPWLRRSLDAMMMPSKRSLNYALEKRASFLSNADSGEDSLDEAVQYALRLASAAGDLFKEEASLALRRMLADARLGHRCRGMVFNTAIADPFEIMDLQIEEGILPTDKEYAHACDVMKGTTDMRFYSHRGCPYPANRPRLPAVVVGLRFLRNLPHRKKILLRRIRLLEDRPTGYRLEDRAENLVQHCIEYPKLHIERKVCMWDTIYARALISRSFPSWLAESLTWLIASTAMLPRLGMPRGSFTLVLDAQQSPEQATQIVQDFLHRDIAWAKAITLWEKIHPPKHDWRSLRTIDSKADNWSVSKITYSKDEVIQAVEELLAGTSSLIRCNFDPGQPCDVAPISAQLKGLKRRLEVKQAFQTRGPHVHETRPPLPSWQALHEQWEERPPRTDPVPGYHRQVEATEEDSDVPERNEEYSPSDWEFEWDTEPDSDAASDISDRSEPTPDDREAFHKRWTMEEMSKVRLGGLRIIRATSAAGAYGMGSPT